MVIEKPGVCVKRRSRVTTESSRRLSRKDQEGESVGRDFTFERPFDSRFDLLQ